MLYFYIEKILNNSQSENEQLRTENDRLVGLSLSYDKEHDNKVAEISSLRAQVNQLEKALQVNEIFNFMVWFIYSVFLTNYFIDNLLDFFSFQWNSSNI